MISKNNFQGFVTNCHNFFLTYPEFRLKNEVIAIAAPKIRLYEEFELIGSISSI